MNVREQSDFRQSILEQVKRIVLSHLSGKPAKAFLFGSWARSEEKRSSDIDVAVAFDTNEGIDLSVMASIRHALEESTIPYEVDVVLLNTADETIASKIKQEGILWGVPANE